MTLLEELMINERSSNNKEVKNKYKKMVKYIEADKLHIQSKIEIYHKNGELGQIMELAGKGDKRVAIVSKLKDVLSTLSKG